MRFSFKYIFYGCRNTFLSFGNLIKDYFLTIKYNIFIIKDKSVIELQLDKFSDKTLVLLNHFGGGTEKYIRQNFYRGDYIHLTQCNYHNGFCYCLHILETNKRLYFDKTTLPNIISQRLKGIIVNSLVGFSDETTLLNQLTTVKKNNKSIFLLYLVHDFHSICPSVHLYYGDCYCKMECTKCGNEEYRRIAPERQKRWFSFLSVCDEIRTFSLSSKKLLLSIYPNLIEQQISVVPHDMTYCTFEPLVIEKHSKNRIAIIGTIISICKGMIVVKDFLHYCINKDINLYLIGTLCKDYIVNAPNIHYLGKYKSQDLKNILQFNKINAVFFPSVLPETFSYLIHELMIMQIPIVGFDIGAQGECLSSYKYGLTLPINAPNEEIYKALISLLK